MVQKSKRGMRLESGKYLTVNNVGFTDFEMDFTYIPKTSINTLCVLSQQNNPNFMWFYIEGHVLKVQVPVKNLVAGKNYVATPPSIKTFVTGTRYLLRCVTTRTTVKVWANNDLFIDYTFVDNELGTIGPTTLNIGTYTGLSHHALIVLHSFSYYSQGTWYRIDPTRLPPNAVAVGPPQIVGRRTPNTIKITKSVPKKARGIIKLAK